MTVKIITGDCRHVLAMLPAKSVNCCVTSPPYFGLRDYGVEGQTGLEATPEAFVAEMVAVFCEVWRVLKDDGVLWLNLGDSYAGGGGHSPNAPSSKTSKSGKYGDALKQGGIKPQGVIKTKDLIGIPWKVAFALQAAGWWLRQDIIWAKPNPMPESVTDRCTRSHEYIFMLTKSARYYYDIEAIKEPMSLSSVSRLAQPNLENQKGSARVPRKTNGVMKAVGKLYKQRGHGKRHEGFNARWDAMNKTEQCSGMRNKRSVWNVAPIGFKEAHFATFPPKLIEPCILAGCPEGGTVLDPFSGAGTTGLVAEQHKRNAILIELNPAYVNIALRRIHGDVI